jgi:hypothetical protein
MVLDITTPREWVDKLSTMSDIIAGMRLKETISTSASLNGDALNFANSQSHQRLIARATNDLVSQGSLSLENAMGLLKEMVTRNTYGAFSELAGYDWLVRSHVKIKTRVELSATDVLGTNGSILDGKFEYIDTYFDIKAFGLHGRLAQRLKQRLEDALPGEQVFVEESWDLSDETFAELIADAPQIAAELEQKKIVRKGPMLLRVQAPQQVTVSGRVVQPYRLARENALYPFRDAKQFTRHASFILVLVLHPWLNANAIQDDFGGTDTCFTRALARRAFFQFSHDARKLNTLCNAVDSSVSLADAAQLLSAIFFINVWPGGDDEERGQPLPCWLYANPRASHPVGRSQMGLFMSLDPNGIYIDDFADDNY